MAKHVTKSVIEDTAYQLKRVGLIVKAWSEGSLSEELAATYNEANDLGDPTTVVDWMTDNMAEVFAEHDPSFNSEKFYQQAAYKAIDTL